MALFDSLPFIYPLALLGLLSIIPLIILYMLLPKPFKVDIPSVMFLIKTEESREKIYSSITKIVKDPLFIAQLLVLILLAVAAAGPFITSYDTYSDEHTVIIIDASGSMQTSGRFDQAKNDAPKYLSRVNTVILAGSVPIVVAENVSASEATSVIRSLTPKSTTADLGSSIAAAANVLSAKGGSIYVFSDFTSWEGLNPLEAKNLLGSGLNIQYIAYGTPTENNLAIVGGYLEKSGGGYNYRYMVRNYDSSPKTVSVSVTTTLSNGSKNTYSPITITVPANNVGSYVFQNVPRGTTEIKLNVNDALPGDDAAYVSIPEIRSARALYIHDAGSRDLPSQIALSLIPELSLDVAENVPPSISSEYSFVVVNMGKRTLRTEEISALNNYASGGGNVVFVAGEYLTGQNQTLDLSKMLPVRVTDMVTSQIGTQVYVVGSDIVDGLNMEDIYMRTYLLAEPRDTQSSSYPALARDRSPVIAYGPYSSGMVFYIGFNDHAGDDAWNNFAGFPEFPVFWIRLTNYFAGIGDISEYNVKAGSMMILPEETEIITPEGRTKTNRVLFETAGIYTVGQKKIAVNMYNDKESNTLLPRLEGIDSSGNANELPTLYEIQKNIFFIFACLAVIFMVVELYLLRKRGDI
ncbi:MAG: VWA domain-containing protein [Methanimicrococcus sp.]|nr:VWA domain-containing protein [Methanimicrococcus sp.]